MQLIIIYTLIAGLIAGLTSPFPGTSLVLTGLEVLMIVHLSKKHNFKLSLKEIGFTATAIWGISTVLQDIVLELMVYIPDPGWIARVIVAVVFVFFLGVLANLYFKK